MGEGSLIRGARGRYAAFTHDLVMVPLARFGVLWLRFNLGGRAGHGRDRRLPDLVRIAKAVLTGSVAVALVLFMTTRLERAATAECVNAIARGRGLRQFRGLRKVKAVAVWYALAHNLMRGLALAAPACCTTRWPRVRRFSTMLQ